MRRDGGKVLIDTVPAKEYAYIIFRGNPLSHEIDMLNMPIKTLGDRIVLLKDIATWIIGRSLLPPITGSMV